MSDFVLDTTSGNFAPESMNNERTKVTDLLFGVVAVLQEKYFATPGLHKCKQKNTGAITERIGMAPVFYVLADERVILIEAG